MDVIINSTKKLKIDESIFSVIMDATTRNLENRSLDAAYQIAQQKLSLINFQTAYSPEDQLSIIKLITIEDVRGYWNLIYNNVFIEGSSHGNISKRDVLKLSSKLRNSFGYKSINKEDCFNSSRLELLPGTQITDVLKSRVNNSAYVSYYNMGENSTRDRAMAMLIKTYIGQPYYMELRTNQQLGYIVAAGAYSKDNFSGMYCIVQSDSYTPEDVEKRSKEFLLGSIDGLNNLGKEQFETFKSAVKEQINEKSTSISKEADRRHIIAYEFENNYDRDAQTIKALNEITIQDLKNTLSMTLNEDTKRNVTILLYANGLDVPENVTPTFEELDNWKQLQLYK